MQLKEMGANQVITVAMETTLEEAARVMRDEHVGDVVVVSDHKPRGILTDRDIVMTTIALGAPANPLTAGDLMSADLVTILETESVSTLVSLMKRNGVRRVPLVKETGELVGIVSVEDVMSYLARELTALSEISIRQREKERHRRRNVA